MVEWSIDWTSVTRETNVQIRKISKNLKKLKCIETQEENYITETGIEEQSFLCGSLDYNTLRAG